jgi:hypothetical protein
LQRPTINVVVDSKQYFPTRIFTAQDRASSKKHDGRFPKTESTHVSSADRASRPSASAMRRRGAWTSRGSAKAEKQKRAKENTEKPADLSGKSVWFTVFCCPYEKLPIVVRHFSQDGRDIIRVVTYRNDIVSLEFAKGWSNGWRGESMQVKLVA